MKYLIIGSGAREHALAHTLHRTTPDAAIFCAPGNTGTAGIATNVDLKADQIGGLVDFVRQKDIDLTIVGPEAPLVAGLADMLRKSGRKVLGPGRLAAQLEGSKIFAKQFMRRHNIPTSDFWHFHQLQDLERLLEVSKYPIVLKADGLAAGKGVVICQDAEQARQVAHSFMVERKHGEAGQRLLVEHFLDGTEVSIFCLTDGRTLLVLPTARDYKRAYDGDAGPNTGGMGAISPSPVLDSKTLSTIERKILVPVIHGMQVEGTPYTGVLYVGLMLTKTGPRVLEFNVRFGDPEAQAILTRLKSDLGALLLATVEGRLEDCQPEWDPRPAVTVVLASEGYPDAPRSGVPITNSGLPNTADRVLYHAGTRTSAGKLLTKGGRIFSATALGEDLAEARQAAYELAKSVHFAGALMRSDIGAL